MNGTIPRVASGQPFARPMPATRPAKTTAKPSTNAGWRAHPLRHPASADQLFAVAAAEFFARGWQADLTRLPREDALFAFDAADGDGRLDLLLRKLEGVPVPSRGQPHDVRTSLRILLQTERVFVVRPGAPEQKTPRRIAAPKRPAETLPAPPPRRRESEPELERVEVELVWPAHLVDRLPDDFEVVLSGAGVERQQLDKSAAVADGETMRFLFAWDGPQKTVQLAAKGSGKKVQLWEDHAAGDLDAEIEWGERLAPLLAEPEPVDAAAIDAAGVPEDRRDERDDTFREAFAVP